jgi:3-deoxy-D-manno-octulosonate 8-phosphate phosphatase (KDO 8-P phosphatase)
MQKTSTGLDIHAIVALFSQRGGTFVASAQQLTERLVRAQALLFDWDGVFNAGYKGAPTPAAFSEADSMGTNMLRYGFWRLTGRMPVTAIISGEKNPAADQFARREHFHALYMGVRNKREAVDHIRRLHGLGTDALACIFDDIHDLAMAQACAVRCLVRRSAGALFETYVRSNRLCDYITGCEAGNHAVREVAELMLGLMGVFEDVVRSRVAYDDQYRLYFAGRQAIATRFFRQVDETLMESAPEA